MIHASTWFASMGTVGVELFERLGNMAPHRTLVLECVRDYTL